MHSTEDSKLNARDGGEEYHDALDDFPFYGCIVTFSEQIEFDDYLSYSNKTSTKSTLLLLLLRRSGYHRPFSDIDTVEYSKPGSLVSLENYANARNRNRRLSREIKESERQFQNSENMGSSGSVEVKYCLGSSENNITLEDKENLEKNGEISGIMDANNERIDVEMRRI
ncbi:Hypothetical predicted protein [Olea europaea subsp. europaea]|uniref:Uncharacterized protein n=1 Tax=Olea europaea subsp. europaea TaxID=158383 RepID=A0A8S0P977_OLEEU|nr:Hypothetical predicted protein [Olea europaea subsp. europaea]